MSTAAFLPRKRRLILVRHGQRLDRYLKEVYPSGDDWTRSCFPNSSYKPWSLEMPLHLPLRKSVFDYPSDSPLTCDYSADPPLTCMGEMCAQILGNKMAEQGIDLDAIFSSPAMRCVQTASRILQGYSDLLGQSNLKVRLDAGLYEWSGFDQSPLAFAGPKFYADRGYSVDVNYKPLCDVGNIRHLFQEPFTEFRKRGVDWLTQIFSGPCRDLDTILMVTHAATLVTFARTLLDKTVNEEILTDCVNVPANLSTVMLEEAPSSRKWLLLWPQPVPSFTIRGNSTFYQSWLNSVTY